MALKLTKREGSEFWYIRGSVNGREIFQSTKTTDRKKAERLKDEMASLAWQEAVRGNQGKYFFEAVESYLNAGGEEQYLGKIISVLGAIPLAEINQAIIDEKARDAYPEWKTPSGEKRSYKKSTIKRQFYTPVSSVLHHAADNGWMPYIRVKMPKVEPTTPDWAGQAWFEKLWAVSPEKLISITVFLSQTGCRISEVLALEWADINLDERWAFIRKTKTGEHRTVYLTDMILNHLKKVPLNDRKGCVYRYSDASKVNQELRKKCAIAGIPYKSTHIVGSHTYATMMRRYAGMDGRGLIGTGRWKDIKSTVRYTHVSLSEESKKADIAFRAKSVQ